MPTPGVEPHACVIKQKNKDGDEAQPIEVVAAGGGRGLHFGISFRQINEPTVGGAARVYRLEGRHYKVERHSELQVSYTLEV